MASTTALGPHIRLRRLPPNELPAHPSLAALHANLTPTDPTTFVANVLSEADGFILNYWPKKFTLKSSTKSSPPSTAQVELLTRDVSSGEIPEQVRASTASETWFARSSTHENKAAQGTAEWSEFEQYLLDDHSKHEMDYTPDIYDVHEALSWDPSALIVPGWEKVEMNIFEMCHNLPVVSNRVFSVLVVKAKSTTSASFLTVQLPIDATQVPGAIYSNGRNKIEGETSQQKKDVTPGTYVSVERAELIDEGSKVKWQMATASDAGGLLPMWAQKMGVPGAIIKDVGLVMEFAHKQRR